MLPTGGGTVTLIVDGFPYEVWTDITVNLSVTDMAGQWSLEVSDSRTNPTPGLTSAIAAVSSIEPQAPCQVLYDGILVCTGIVDNVQPSFGPEAHGMQVSCRGKSRNAVDGAAEIPNQEARDIDFGDLAKKTLEPYGLSVKVEAPTSKIPVARPGVTEKAQAFLERYARQQGLLIHEDEAGDVKVRQVQPTAPVAALVEGVNIHTGRSNLKGHKQPSKIKVIGQQPGNDTDFGEKAAAVKAEAEIPGVKWHRPLHVWAETAVAPDMARSRANWEAATRGSEIVDANVTYHGWTYAIGRLWRPGDIAELRSPMLRVARALAIRSVTLRQNDTEGTVAELSLVPPETLSPKASGGKSSGSAAGSSSSPSGSGAAKVPAGGNTANDPPASTPDTSDWWIFSPGQAV